MTNKKTVLLVDDNHDSLDLIEMYLYSDFTVITELNGFEGLKRAEQAIPDLIVTDIMMPVMDGIRFVNNLRKNPATSHIPVIAATAFTHENNRNSLLSIGFDSVIYKPFTRESVLEAIRQAETKP